METAFPKTVRCQPSFSSELISWSHFYKESCLHLAHTHFLCLQGRETNRKRIFVLHIWGQSTLAWVHVSSHITCSTGPPCCLVPFSAKVGDSSSLQPLHLLVSRTSPMTDGRRSLIGVLDPCKGADIYIGSFGLGSWEHGQVS